MDTNHPLMGPMLRACVLATSTLFFAAPSLANSTSGAWARLNALPFYPVHSHTLPSGKVLVWTGDDNHTGDEARQLDPLSQALSPVAKAGYDLFCSGHSFLPDGLLFVAGGHIASNEGFAKTSTYDPVTDTWRALPNMNAGRWYPTVTTLANGDALAVSGDISPTLGNNTQPQVYQRATGTWRSLTSAQLQRPLYPRMFVAPDGRVVDVAPDATTRALDTSGTGQWSVLASRPGVVDRSYGSAVLMDGKAIVVGGGDPPVKNADIIDLNQATPAWSALPAMSVARRHLNATLLPDGTFVVTGGVSAPGFNDTSSAVFAAEIWDPAANRWFPMASATVPRAYHSSATLLPDGRVLTTGGNNELTPEVFSPPYLFKGARPSLTSPPTGVVGYGSQFTVQTDQAAAITKVTLLRLGSVTHGFDANQRLATLAFTRGAASVNITAPSGGNIAPPGHYLLFLVNGTGVPSVGAVVMLGSTGSTTPPAASITSMSPNTAVAGSGGFPLSVTGTGFAAGAAVNWNGLPRTTTVTSPTQVSAQIPATDVAAAGTANVTVVNSGAAASNALPFTVTAGTPPPPPPPPTPTFRLTVTKSGNEAGRGTITSTPAGINCGSTCSATFAEKTNVSLTVRVVGNARFVGWGGACSGTGACVVPMTVNQTVTAAFARR